LLKVIPPWSKLVGYFFWRHTLFQFNPNYMDLYITYFLSRIQRAGLKKSRKSGKFWRSICRVSTIFLILN
jgi:hypothetical protein